MNSLTILLKFAVIRRNRTIRLSNVGYRFCNSKMDFFERMNFLVELNLLIYLMNPNLINVTYFFAAVGHFIVTFIFRLLGVLLYEAFLDHY